MLYFVLMRKVFFSYNFHPMRNPRAFRMEKLIRSGYSDQDDVIITSKSENEKVKDEKNIIRLRCFMNPRNAIRQQLKTYSLLRSMHRFIWPDDKILFNLWSLIYYLIFLRKRDDRIFTVSHPFSTHLIGYFLKRFYKHSWTTDIGDLFYLPFKKAHFIKKWNLKFEQKIVTACDHILVNADSMRDYFAEKYNLSPSKFQIIPNGTRLDFSKLKRQAHKNLQLSFVGNTYEGVRDGLSEIEILIQLHHEYPELNFNLQLLGMIHAPLLQKINENQSWMQTGVCNTDADLLEIYSRTDLLLNFANKNYPGLPSKLEEYTASGIPIIHFCWQANDPGSAYLRDQKHPFLEFVIEQSALSEIVNFINNSKTN